MEKKLLAKIEIGKVKNICYLKDRISTKPLIRIEELKLYRAD